MTKTAYDIPHPWNSIVGYAEAVATAARHKDAETLTRAFGYLVEARDALAESGELS